jgi:hypothetical protein
MRRADPPTRHPRRHTAARAFRAAVAGMGALVIALLLLGVGQDADPASAPVPATAPAPAPVPVSVSIDAHHPGTPVPRTFLGLSFELSSLPQLARYGESGDLVTLLRSLGRGVLRFGGASADSRTAWTDALTPPPAWASSVVSVGDLHRLRRLAERSGWRILLTIDLAHYDPGVAAREAAAARRALGRWLAGIEVGNEPNAYLQHGIRPAPWTFAQYDAQVAAYRRAIARVAPRIPLAGPGVSGSAAFLTWGRGEAIHQRPALLTGHHYPLSCHGVPAPTIVRLLSAHIRRKESVSIRRYMSVSRARAIRFRLDETNSVSCGGRAGISDTFASALWAVDYVARAMAAGVAGINFHGNVANCYGYSPLCAPTPGRLTAGALRAQPEWYGLLLDKALIGERPVRTILRSPSRANVDVTTMLAAGGRLHLVIVDDDPPGAAPAAVRLHVGPGFAGASILTLTAPSPAAKSGVQLAGRVVQSDGSWQEPSRLPYVPDRGGTIALTVSPASAMLVTVTSARRAH